jgi:hypothetical protein
MGLFDFLKKKKIVKVELDPTSIRDNTQVKALAYENAELKAENVKKEKVISDLKQKEEDKKEEDNIKVYLDEQKKELMSRSQGKVLFLRNFYERLLKDTKFKEKLGYYTFDRKTRLASFGDFGFSEDGSFVLVDNNKNVLLKMKNLNDLFQSVSALGNDMARGIIPVNLDEEGSYIENVMAWEAPELIDTGNKLRFAKARKKPVYEIIKRLNNIISDLQSDLAEEEALNINLQKKIDTLMANKDLNQQIAETSRAELSNIEKSASGIDKSFRMLQRDLAKYQNLGVVLEDNLAQMERELSSMRSKAEREGVKLNDEKALEIIQQIRGTMVNEMPDNIPAQENTNLGVNK